MRTTVADPVTGWLCDIDFVHGFWTPAQWSSAASGGCRRIDAGLKGWLPDRERLSRPCAWTSVLALVTAVARSCPLWLLAAQPTLALATLMPLAGAGPDQVGLGLGDPRQRGEQSRPTESLRSYTAPPGRTDPAW
jgi:hypothetical protein